MWKLRVVKGNFNTQAVRSGVHHEIFRRTMYSTKLSQKKNFVGEKLTPKKLILPTFSIRKVNLLMQMTF